jgi:hypothetical protein
LLHKIVLARASHRFVDQNQEIRVHLARSGSHEPLALSTGRSPKCEKSRCYRC